MVVFGGTRKNLLAADEVANDVWRFWYDTTSTSTGYKWAEVLITNANSSDAPGPRNGHVALWHAPSRSALVFGGRSTPNGSPTDGALYRLAFTADMTTATWSKLSATGPGPRADMAFAYTSEWIHDSHTHAFLFGGELASGKSEQLWDLQLSDDLSTVSWSQVNGLSGAPPSPRSGTAMLARESMALMSNGASSIWPGTFAASQ